jgi:sulfoxide reductase catalytic subunit YedY
MTEQLKSVPVKPSEITPKHLYYSRRDFLRAMGVTSAGALLAACAPRLSASNAPTPVGIDPAISKETDELGDPVNSYQDITHYNNYYEFSTDKQAVASLAEGFTTSPWSVKVYGLCSNPQTYGVEDLIKKFPPQEHIYRLRCVEAWSMVIPWEGFALAELLKEVQPTSDAKYVRFESVMDTKEMPGQKAPLYPWPYQEGLRLDEAMNDLAILATGLYGEPLPPQDGAPIRLVVPWKYGFKSIKAIVKIELVADQPPTMWSTIAPNEYGFYANVNPDVPHPRWSQASERRIGELARRPTLMFNGYGEQVASLYEGMDLKKNF